MSTEILQRSLFVDEIEIEGAEGRTLHARMMHWDTPSLVSDGGPMYEEVWRKGVFAQSIKRAMTIGRGWPLMFNHDRTAMPLGMVASVHERSDGPWMTAKISRTSTGDDIIELIRDGAVPGVSVGATAIKSKVNANGQIERIEVALREVSMTPFPALQGADELVLRNQQQEKTIPGSRAEFEQFIASLDDR